MADTNEKKTILSSMGAIISAAYYEEGEGSGKSEYYRFDKKLIEEVQEYADYLAEQLAISPKQAVLFSIIVEISKCDDIDKGELASSLKTNFIQLLSYEEDLRALENAYLIQRASWGKISIRDEVLQCLENNKPYHRPSVKGLPTFTILSRITRLLKAVRQDGLSRNLALFEMDEMILSNPGTSIAKAANKYSILKEASKHINVNDYDIDSDWSSSSFGISACPAERMLFYALCYRYQEYNDDECGWWDFRDFFDESTMETIQQRYKDEKLDLQTKRVITYASRDGMFVKDRFKIEDSVKEEILADCGGLHEDIPFNGLIKKETLEEKMLFFDSVVKARLNTLGDLLSEKRYALVKTALEEKGMRSGFTCLFYGSPGTGKTESVYQLARKTGRDIIMADVSKLKSMWVGESEKNMRRLFRNYKELTKKATMTPILLFNEADAIFGIRKTGADGAVDKMENSLQNIILQEMEDLKGILIATTNLTENLDKAFERRFLYKVRFDKPSVEARTAIWRSMIPELSETEATLLATDYDFSGGQIENVSRKRAIAAILETDKPDFAAIRSYCEEETLTGTESRRKIGF